MSKEVINIGTVANDGTGDRIRVAFTKTNNNFTELYNTNSTQNTSINAAFLQANGAFAVANSSSIYANGAFGVANTASVLAQAAFNYANTIVSDTQVDPYSRNHANASFLVANSTAAYSNTVDETQNTNISYIWNYANAAFSYANTISGGSAIDNVARVAAATADDKSTSAGVYANGAFTSANNEAGVNATQNTNITIAQNTANAGFVHANGAFAVANNEAGVNATQNTNITNAQNTGSAAFNRANNSLNANTGGEISGNLLPTTTNTYYLGSDANRWHSLYVGPGSIDLGGLVLSNQNGTLAVSVGGQPPTQISGSDEYARNTANAAFASANNIDGINATQNTNIQFAWNHANSAFESANNVAPQIEPAFTTANGAFAKANNEAGVNATQNTNITNAQNTADASFIHANAAFAKANNEAGVNATQNTNITIVQNTAQAAFEAANAAGSSALVQYASNHANGAFIAANTADDKGTSAGIYANGSFAKANNEAGVNVTQNTNITTAQNTGDAAFIRANNSLNANNGGTITGDLSISGNLSVLGNTFTVSATTIVANDTVLVLGAGNYTSDLLDIGISAHYNDGVNAHTGLIRDHGTKEWQLFEGYTGEIGANNDVIITDPSFKKATLNANLKTQLITLNSQDLQTYIDGSYNKANAAFASANNIDGINTTQNNSITAAFVAANNEAGVNATQNTNIQYAWNHANSVYNYANTLNPTDTFARDQANAAFLTANTANNTANIAYRTNYISATRQRLVPFQEGGITFRYRFPDVAGPTANSPTLSVIAGQTYAFDLSALQSSGFGGFQLMTASPFASGSLLSGVTHVSTTGQVTTNVSTSYTSGTLYWTAPTSLVGNTTIGYGDSTYNGIYGSIRVYRADDIAAAFTTANTANNNAIYTSLTPAATKFRIIEGPSSSTWQIDQYSGNFPTIYVISGQTYVFNFNFQQDVGGSGSYFRLLDDSNTEFTGNVAYVSSANSSSVTGASYSSTFKTVGSVYWKVPTSAEGKTYKYQNGNNFNTGNIVIISHSALAAAANSAGSDTYARNHANSAYIHANSSFAAANSASIYANGAFTAANNASDSIARNLANASFSLQTGTRFIRQEAWAQGQSILGDSTGDQRSSPVQLVNNNTNWKKLAENSPNYSINAGIKTDGSLWIWGSASSGQGGNSSTGTFFSPVQTGTATNWKMVSVFDSVAAIKTDGTLWTWGVGTNGVLGNNSTVNRSSPVQVGSLTTWTTVAHAANLMIAIQSTGTMWSWGGSPNGAGGRNTINDEFVLDAPSSPVQIGANTSWKSVYIGAAGFTSAWAGAVTREGYLYMWGRNNEGQLGLNDRVARSSPVQVGSSTGWKQLGLGGGQNGGVTLAVKTDGTLWTWGFGIYRATGHGDQTARSSPTQVGTATNWKKVLNADLGSVGIKTDGTLWSWGTNFYGAIGENQTFNSTVSALYQHQLAETHDSEWIDLTTSLNGRWTAIRGIRS